MTSRIESYPVISADSHVNEPPNVWEERLPAKFKERGPKVVGANGTKAWTWEGRPAPSSGTGRKDVIRAGSGMATRTRAYFGKMITKEDVDEDVFSTSPDVWLKDMDIDGVDISLLYPGVGMSMYTIQDQELRLACLRAYNDWLADFCKKSDGRLVGVAIIPFDDGVEKAAKELERAAGMGLRGGLMPTWPEANPFTDAGFDRFWATAQELDIPLSLHRGVGLGGATTGSIGHHPSAGIVFRFFASVQVIGNMVFTGVFDRFPGLKVVSVESNFGWAPFVFEQSDDQHRRQSAWDNWSIKRKPSDYWRENIYYTFLEDHYGVKNRYDIGVDKLMWSTDYPHTVTLFPDSRKYIADMFQGVPDSEKELILSGNARRLYKI